MFHPGVLEQARRRFYRDGRPSAIAKALNKGQALAFSAGLRPDRLATLEVRGCRSGRSISFPVVVADYDGERYLVAMLGERARWVRNVEAADGRAVLRHGRRESVRLVAVPPDERAPILRRYVECAPGARAHITVDRGAPLKEFEHVAPHIPVFRITPEPTLAASDGAVPAGGVDVL